MSDKQYKLIRKQLRNVVQEALPNILTQDLVTTMRNDLLARVDVRLDDITKAVKSKLDEMDTRSKNIQSYVLRNVGVTEAPKSE